MDDTTVLEAVRKSDPTTTEAIAHTLSADAELVEKRLDQLESSERIEYVDGEWRLARDPRLDESISHMQERVNREKR